jgi:GntR family transcriptional repressor for pyruvate dehydrogenase complex
MDNSLPIQKIKQKTKCDTVVDEVISMIVKGIYKEGDKLPPENVLCEKFGVSRVTIRESFKKLNMMGAVTIKQGEGTYVAHTDMSIFMKPLLSSFIFDSISIDELYDARQYVEAGTVSLAARHRSPEDIAVLRSLLAQMRIAVDNHDLRAFAQLDTDFHTSVGRISKNSILHMTYLTIKDILDGYIMKTNRNIGMIDSSLKTHVLITEAIEAGDDQLAASIMSGHVRRARSNLISSITETEVS